MSINLIRIYIAFFHIIPSTIVDSIDMSVNEKKICKIFSYISTDLQKFYWIIVYYQFIVTFKLTITIFGMNQILVELPNNQALASIEEALGSQTLTHPIKLSFKL